MKPNPNPDATDLEEAFFARENARVLEDLRDKAARDERRELLRQVVDIHDDAFLDRLIAMDIGPEKALALRLIPLVVVAWADGSVDERERKAILDAAAQRGVTAESSGRALLQSWLEHRPPERLYNLWKTYIAEVWNRFTFDEQLKMRRNLLESAKGVAEAAGGFLGLAKISSSEQAVLDELEKLLQ